MTAVPPATLAAIHARFARGDGDGAWSALTPLLASHPADAKLLQLAGLVRRGLGDLPGARELLKRSAAAGGGAEVLNTLGNVLVELGADDDADRAFARAAAADPGDPNPLINRGRLASRRGRHPAALAHLRQAVTLAPRSPVASVALGNALRASGEADAAVVELQRARGLDPSRASTGVHLGVALTAADRAADAIAAYDAAERAGDRTPPLIHNRAAARVALGELSAARDEYDRLVATHPGYLEGHRERARLIHEFGLDGDPFGSFAALAAQYPREPSVWQAWLQAALGFRRYGTAGDVAARARTAIGDDPAVIYAQAIALSETGETAAAGDAFAGLRNMAAALPGLEVAHARHLLRAREPAQAAAACEAALAAAPDDQMAWAYLGTAWRLLDDPREYWLHDYDRHVGVALAAPPGGENPGAFIAQATETLRQLHVTRVHPADQSLRNGTQTPGALFDRREPAIRAIEAAVRAAVLRFIDGLPDDPAHPFLRRNTRDIAFAGSWSVRLTREGFHINHVHTAGWISSAYYFVLPERTGDEGALTLGVPPVELGLNLPPRRIVRPEVGQLALFPSSMWHGTVPFARDAERLTVAFDVIPAP